MLTNFVDQEFKKGTMETVHLCYLMSGVSAGNKWKDDLKVWGRETSRSFFTHMSDSWAGRA